MNILKSKTFWGAVLAAVTHVLAAYGIIPTGPTAAIGEAIGGVIATVGLRGAVAKNGNGN